MAPPFGRPTASAAEHGGLGVRRLLIVLAAGATGWWPATAAATTTPDEPGCAEVSDFDEFQFADRALAVSSSGSVYTTSGITVTGRSGSTVVFSAVAPSDFTGLIDMAVTGTDEVVALDSSGRIVRFAADGTTVGIIDVGPMHTQEGSIAVHPDGRIWVADPFTNTLRAFLPDGSPDIEVDGGERPGDIEVAPNGELVTVDGFERAIRWHSDVGERLREVTIGHVNTGEVEIAVDLAGRVYLSDPFTDTVQVFAPSGEHVLTVNSSEFPIALDRPVTIESLPNGGVIVGDSAAGRSHVVVLPATVDPAVVTIQATESPLDIAVGQTGRIDVRVSVAATCHVGPFEITRTVPPGLTVTASSDDGTPWDIELLEPAADGTDFWLDVVPDNVGTWDVSFVLSGPGVLASVTVTVVAADTTTTTATTGAPTDGQLPETGSRGSIAAIGAIALALGLVLVRRSRRTDQPANAEG